jgi:hypothetical protein
MLAAGKAIDPFWRVYQQHLSSPFPQQILKTMRYRPPSAPLRQPSATLLSIRVVHHLIMQIAARLFIALACCPAPPHPHHTSPTPIGELRLQPKLTFCMVCLFSHKANSVCIPNHSFFPLPSRHRANAGSEALTRLSPRLWQTLRTPMQTTRHATLVRCAFIPEAHPIFIPEVHPGTLRLHPRSSPWYVASLSPKFTRSPKLCLRLITPLPPPRRHLPPLVDAHGVPITTIGTRPPPAPMHRPCLPQP